MTLYFLLYIIPYCSSVNSYYGGNVENHLRPQDPSGTILIQDSIYQCFHNINAQLGGCIYIHDSAMTVLFNSVGFVDCTTTNEGGALSIKSCAIKIQNTCAYLCEAFHRNYQFAKLECNVDHNDNRLAFLTIVSCGPSNNGKAAFGIYGEARFFLSNYNASNNMNDYDSSSYGSCFQTHNILYHQTSFVNFLNSHGYDVFNTHVLENVTFIGTGSFDHGNVYNCSTRYIYQFRGVMTIDFFKFGILTFTNGSFKCGSGTKTRHSLTFSNSKIDKFPTGILDSNIHINGGCSLEIPIITLDIQHYGTEYCILPTKPFSNSNYFTDSSYFTPSSKFTPSINFSPSSEFTSSNYFSSSSKFTSSNSFSSSSMFSSSNSFSSSKGFTSSNSFSPSQKFSPSASFSPTKKFSPSNIFSSSSKFTSTPIFSPSPQFTSSTPFSPSRVLKPCPTISSTEKFTSSGTFSPSTQFTLSITFSPSSEFSPSRLFSPTPLFVLNPTPISLNSTDTFTPSSPFTPSFTFKPNATKYPDGRNNNGIGRAQVSGGSADKPASAAQIGVTTGISFTFIIVAVVLMLLYLRSKRAQMNRSVEDFSEGFTEDGKSSSSSYSYSYYTYEYYSRSVPYDSYDYSYSDIHRSEFELSYSDFEGTYISLDDQY